jgi:orotate phosphoribosyltransferase
MTGTLADRIRAAALIEGDFVLRSGRRSRYYLDKYRLATQPDLLREVSAALAARIEQVAPDAQRMAAPELGAVAFAAACSLVSNRPFLIVRSEAKQYGTANRLEGVFNPGERIVLLEDVVTTGGAAVASVKALREAGLLCRVAVCVVDRDEGGREALSAQDVTLHPLLTRADLAV